MLVFIVLLVVAFNFIILDSSAANLDSCGNKKIGIVGASNTVTSAQNQYNLINIFPPSRNDLVSYVDRLATLCPDSEFHVAAKVGYGTEKQLNELFKYN